MVRPIKKRPLKKQSKVYENHEEIEQLKKFALSENMDDNIDQVKQYVGNSFDFKVRKFKIADWGIYAAIMYLEGMVNEDMILEHIVKPLIIQSALGDNVSEPDFQRIRDSMMSPGEVREANTYDKIIQAVLSGSTFLCIDGFNRGFIITTVGYPVRPLSEPTTEPTVKGPKEGFVESLTTNVALIRKRIRDPNLVLESHKIGRRSKGDVVIVYVKGIVQASIVDEVRRRILAIDSDDHMVSDQVANLISDSPNSIFPLVHTTERPDKAVVSILEGRVAVIVEGSPGVLLVPVTLVGLMQSSDDYYEKWIVSSAIRILRYTALFISAFLPAAYIAITSFHPGLLPTNMLLSITGTRLGVPFPAVIEAVLMEVTLELLQEAGIRLPRVVGQTISIVGGLVIGQAAVQAGVISPIMVIIISMTAISSYVLPDYSLGLATRILRIPFMLLATTFGAFGIVMGLMYLLGYTCSLKSFGVYYMSPLTPYNLSDWKDTMIRGPQAIYTNRPEFLSPEDTVRQNLKKEGGSGEKK